MKRHCRNAMQGEEKKVEAPKACVTSCARQAGNHVQSSHAVLALVLRNVGVTNNFKGTQLTHVQVGQPVQLNVDSGPNRKFKGKVERRQAQPIASGKRGRQLHQSGEARAGQDCFWRRQARSKGNFMKCSLSPNRSPLPVNRGAATP